MLLRNVIGYVVKQRNLHMSIIVRDKDCDLKIPLKGGVYLAV